MENIKPGMLYISADGDGIGKLVGRAVLANDVDELHAVSRRIDAAQDFILHWCEQVGGIKISGGGDEFTAAIPPDAKEKLKSLRQSVEKAFGYTISVGVGRSLSEAGTGLLVAKLRGKDRIVYFNKHIKDDIRKAKRRVRAGRATQEEYKLSEAYLEKSESMLCNLHKSKDLVSLREFKPKPGKYIWTKPVGSDSHGWHHEDDLGSKIPGFSEKEISHTLKAGDKLPPSPHLHKSEEGKHASAATHDDVCPYCTDNEDNRTDDCAYCQDLDAEENADGTAGMHDCPACKEYDASQQNTGGIDDCPYCQPENINEAQANPEQPQDHICNCPYCEANKNDQSDLAVQDSGAQRPDECAECQKMYGDAVENQPDQTGQGDPALQGHETAQEVLNLLDQEPGASAQTPAQAAKKIDNTEMPQGDQTKENVSVKDNFGSAQKQDISDSDKQFQGQDDSPQMGEILQGHLDDHADQIQREKVIAMVSQTLQGFKANKQLLEATKDQNEGLYSSCIQMLKSMIELCKLLGLEPKMTTPQAEAPQVPQAPEQNGAPAPAQAPAAPAEGAAQSPKL